MAWIRQLPSGLWAATVYTPAGRITESHELKGTISKWAANLESDVRQGHFVDPRKANTTVSKAWTQLAGARRLEKASVQRDASAFKCHVQPRWGKVAVGAILRPDIQAWVNKMEADGWGAWTILGALNCLSSLLELCVDAEMIRANPARRVKRPITPEHEDRVIEPHEEQLIYARLDELFPGRRDARLFVETLLETGARWSEAAGIRREAINLADGLISIGSVVQRDGTFRDYPKGARSRSSAGFREAPISPALVSKLRPVLLATPAGGFVFTAPRGERLLYPNWRQRVWLPALQVAVRDEKGRRVRGPDGEWLWTPLLEGLLPTPHDCRHTYGTRLADGGVEQHHRMALMGHADVRSAQRYTHSGDARFAKAREVLAEARRLAGNGS